LLSATDMDHILDVAATMFNEVMGAIHTAIYLKPGANRSPVQADQLADMTQLPRQQK
jgi:hypothetical protein